MTTQPPIPVQVPLDSEAFLDPHGDRHSSAVPVLALIRPHDTYSFAGLSQPLRFISGPLHPARLCAITGKCSVMFERKNEASSDTTPPRPHVLQLSESPPPPTHPSPSIAGVPFTALPWQVFILSGEYTEWQETHHLPRLHMAMWAAVPLRKVLKWKEINLPVKINPAV